MATWLEDRMTLKKMARDQALGLAFQRPIHRTLVYACIAHMRGHVHMTSYGRKMAGWWNPETRGRQWEVGTLANQKQWIRWALQTSLLPTPDLIGIVWRVLDNDWEPPKVWEGKRDSATDMPSLVSAIFPSTPLGNSDVKC